MIPKKINVFVFSVAFIFPLLIFLKKPGYNPYSMNELLITAILMIYILFLMNYKIKTIQKTEKKICKMPTLYIFFLLLYIFYQFYIAFDSDSYVAAFSSILLHDKYIALSILVVYFVDEKTEKDLIYFIILVALASAYIGVLKIAQNPSALSSLYNPHGGYVRKAAVFPNPNMYGVYLLIPIFLSFVVLDEIKSNKQKILFLIFVLFPFLLSLLMTFSRRSWGLFVLGLLVYVLLKKGSKKGLITPFVLIFFLLPYYIDVSSIVKRFSLIFDSDYKSNSLRKEAFSDQMKLLKSDIFILLGGNGVGMCGPNIIFTLNGKWKQVDNYYAELLLEFGAIGLLLYFLIFIVIFIYAIKNLKRSDGVIYNKNLIYITVISALYLSSVVGSTPISFPTDMLQWIFVGLIFKNNLILEWRVSNEKI